MAYNKKAKPVVRPTREAEPELFKEVLEIDDANERSEALAELDLTEGQKDAAQVAARKDFLDGGVTNELTKEEEVKPLNNRAQKLVDELTAKNIIVPYPSDFSKWDAATFERLEKLNK